MHHRLLTIAITFLSVIVFGCSVQSLPKTYSPMDGEVAVDGLFEVPLFSADHALFETWTEVHITGKGDWRLVSDKLTNGVAIRGLAQNSASALMRRADIDPVDCPILEWRWRVGSVQSAANIKQKESDDVAAGLFVLFGDPGSLLAPMPVPTVRYVWTNDTSKLGETFANPYMPETVINIVLRSTAAGVADWVTERRNLSVDFERAYARPPDDSVWVIALFVDNDQTREDATAFFKDAKVYCL